MEQNDYQNVQQTEMPSEIQTPAPNGSDKPTYSQSQSQENSGLSVASMVLGIVALVLSCVIPISAICSLLSLIFGMISLVNHKDGKGMAIAGVVCGAIAGALILSYSAVWDGFWDSLAAVWKAIFEL